MSALVAILRRDDAPADPAAAWAALEVQRARGPDAHRVWAGGAVTIGHGLLATTFEEDLASQPFVAEGGALVVALDGRLDNRAELADATGLVEARSADVELIAAAYRRWGDTFARRLLGDFALVLWDARRRELLCARDPLAARPLYVRADHRALRCASDPRALFAKRFRPDGVARSASEAGGLTSSSEAALAAPQASFDAMALFLAEQYVERRFTLFRGVEALPAGATLVLRAGSSEVRTIPAAWPGPVAPSAFRSAAEHEEAFRATLREAVRARMRARGRVAVHVSGGLDSSSIAALAVEVARERGGTPPVLVRCVFPGLACDESPLSQAVADHLGLSIESVEMPGNFGDFDPDRTRAGAYENPISMMLVRMMERTNGLDARANGPDAPTDGRDTRTSRFDVRADGLGARAGNGGDRQASEGGATAGTTASQDPGVRVTLTGAGSDQLLFPTGFEIQGALLRGDVRRALDLAGVLASPLAVAPYGRLLRDGVGRALPATVRRAIRRLRGRGDGLPTWMTEAARAAVRRGEEAAPSRTNRGDFPSPAARQLAERLAGNADYSYGLVLADRIAAGASADMRHPFFDRRVIDLLLSFPDEVRSAAPPPKALLRRAMGPSLPAVVRDRSSAAEFSALVRKALVEPYGERLAAMVRRGRLADAGLIDGAAAAAAILRARTEDDTIREVMMLAWLELWLRAIDP